MDEYNLFNLGKVKKKRKGISPSQKEHLLFKQDWRCTKCSTKFTTSIRPHYDHKNGDRSDNRISNFQALCPNCHDHKSRNENIRRAKNKRTEKEKDPLGLNYAGYTDSRKKKKGKGTYGVDYI